MKDAIDFDDMKSVVKAARWAVDHGYLEEVDDEEESILDATLNKMSFMHDSYDTGVEEPAEA